MGPPSVGMLPYTVTQGRIAVLLWKHDFTSLGRAQSATYWSEMVCEQTKDDPSAISAAARIFSERTLGCLMKKKKKLKELKNSALKIDAQIADSHKQILGILKKRNGTLMLFRDSYPVYVFPVRFVKQSKLSNACSRSGSAEWIWFTSLISAIKENDALQVHNIDNSKQLQLYLQFSSLLQNCIETFEELSDVVKEMNIELKPSDEHLPDDEQKSFDDSSIAPVANAQSDDDEQSENEDPNVIFLCKRCRKELFSDIDIVEHDMGWGHNKNEKHKRVYCGSWFLNEDTHLLAGKEGGGFYNEGKLECPKCLVKIGHFEFSGAQCSCGRWITPAIQVPKSKVDEKYLRQATTPHIMPAVIRRPVIIKPQINKDLKGSEIVDEKHDETNPEILDSPILDGGIEIQEDNCLINVEPNGV